MTRVAKTPQYLAFNQRSNCYGRFQEHDGQLNTWRQKDRPLMLEVGAGTALLSAQFCQLYPNWQVLAVDKKSDRLGKTARQTALDWRFANSLAFLQAHLSELDAFIDLKNQVNMIWLAFPDPYPTKRQAKHRLTYPQTLGIYKQLLVDGGVIRFKTDDLNLFNYTLKVFKEVGWLKITSLNLDLNSKDDLPQDVLTLTSYEQRFRQRGLNIHYLQADKK